MILLVAACASLSLAATPKPVAPAKSNAVAVGTIEVGRLNQGAKIFLDDKPAGTAPATLKNVVAGEHKITLRKLGYLAAEAVVNVEANKTVTVQVNLLPYAGIFTVKTNPKGAQIFVDGKGAGVTPYEGEITIGRRSVEVRKDGYLTHREVFQVGAGASYKIDTRLKKSKDLPQGEVQLAALASRKKKTTEADAAMDIPLEARPALAPISSSPNQGPLSGGGLFSADSRKEEQWYKKWWVWTIVGAVVVSAVVIPVAVTQSTPAPQQEHAFRLTF